MVDPKPFDFYGSWYELFWSAELTGARLQRELETINLLGVSKPGSRILDLACAFGRISNGLAAGGHKVTGVDISLDLILSAKGKAVSRDLPVDYIVADLKQMCLAPVHACVLLWSTTLGHFTEEGDLVVLANAYRSLTPGGRLLIETRHWDSIPRVFESTTVRSVGDDHLLESHRYDSITAMQWTKQTLLINGKTLEREYGIRRYTFSEMRKLCHHVGFENVAGFDDSGRPLATDSRRCILVATKFASSGAEDA